MKAKLVAFKSRRHYVANNYGIIEVKEGNAASLIGSKVTWRSNGGKIIGGVIVRTHGRDALLARFKKGLPGDAVGDYLDLKLKPLKPKEKPKEEPEKKTARKAAKKKKKAPEKMVKKTPPKKSKKEVKPKKKSQTKSKSKSKSESKKGRGSSKKAVKKK